MTEDGVALDLPPAAALSRIMGGVIDAVILYGLLISGTIGLVTWFDDVSQQVFNIVFILMSAVLLWLVPALITYVTHGASLGKLIAKVRVVSNDGQDVSLRQCMVRSLIGVFEIYATMGILAVAVALFSPSSLRIGDYAAGTYAVRMTRRPIRYAPPTPPESMDRWLDTAVVASPPAQLSNEISEFFTSTMKMGTPETIRRRALELSRQAMAYASPLPPNNCDPLDYLRAFHYLNHESAKAGEQARILRRAQFSQAVKASMYEMAGYGQGAGGR